jgi:predicted nucleic-acid-binding protein
MIGLDTNVLVCYLAQDDVRQSAAATRLIEHELNTAQFEMEHRETVQAATQWVKAAKNSKAGFADRLIAQIALNAGCTHTLSFDKGAVRAAGMVLLV